MMMEKRSNISVLSVDYIFIYSSILFNLFISLLYLFVKNGDEILTQYAGFAVVLLALPFTFTTVKYIKNKAGTRIIVSHAFILFYFFIEILLDYILKIPFREILIIHIPYIIFFYAATFSMIGVSFRINRKMGFVVLATFFILIACLVYLYA
jgi:hypothetical protein